MINCEKIISSFLDCTLIVFNCISAFSVTEGESEFCLKIVHTNDIHSRVIENESGGIIGVSKLKTLIDEHTRNSDMSLVLDSGDLFHGQSIATLVKGESIAKLAGTCGYDAMTAGNHDWNYGKDRLKELVNITNENDVKDFKMLDETNLGRAVTNAYLLETGADVAFENAGGIRASIKKGDVLYGDIIGALPYGNYIVTKTVTGQDLLEILETSIDIQIKSIAANDSGEYDAWLKNSGSYLQIGGMTVEYNISKPYGERVESAFVGAKKLENDSYYTVATNNFAAVSSVYLQLATKEECGEFSACDEALINFFNQDDEKILTSVNTPRMIQTTTPIETVPPTSSVSHSESTAVATAATDPTSATSNTTANAVNKTSTPDTPSNGIATGSGFAIFSIITVVIIFAASFYIFRRKRLIK